MSTATKTESVYKQCAAAIDRLIQNPPRQHSGVFTEIDVQMEAATTGDWDKAEYDKAMHEANEACGQRYRGRKLCRYGPVKIGKGTNAVEDYARIAGKIVYADSVTGPEEWETPNGKFKKLMFEDDTLTRQGRKSAANRNDAEPWDQQVLPTKPRKPARSRSRRTPRQLPNSGDKEVMDLVLQLSRRVDDLEEDKRRRDAFAAEQARRVAA